MARYFLRLVFTPRELFCTRVLHAQPEVSAGGSNSRAMQLMGAEIVRATLATKKVDKK